MRFVRLLVYSLALLLGALAVTARASDSSVLCQSWTFDSRPELDVPFSAQGSWITHVQVRKAERRPSAVLVRLTGRTDGRGLVENTAFAPTPTLTAAFYMHGGTFAWASVELPDVLLTAHTATPGDRIGSLAAADGSVDFKGLSGITTDWHVATDSRSLVITQPALLDALTGDGNPATVESFDSILAGFGGGLYSTWMQSGVAGYETRCSARLVIDYIY